MRNIQFVAILGFLMVGCTANKPGGTKTETGENQKIIWVNKYKVACNGVAPMRCYQIQEADIIDESKWNLTFGEIEDFNFIPGTKYKLLIEEIMLDPANIPADGSSVKLKLIEILDSLKSNNELNGKWNAFYINGAESVMNTENIPFINIDNNMVSGSDGCNDFMTGLIKDENYSFKLGSIALTRKMCADMIIPDSFDKALNNVLYYIIDGNELHLSNTDGLVLLKLRRE